MCLRETFEEIGLQLKADDVEMIYQSQEPDCWNSLIDVYLVFRDVEIAEIIIQKEELSEVRWFSYEDLQKLIDDKEISEMILFALPVVLAKMSH